MTHAAILQIFLSHAIALWNLSHSWLIIFHFVVALKSNVVTLVIRHFCGILMVHFMVPFTFIILKRMDCSAKMWLLQKKESLTGLKWYDVHFTECSFLSELYLYLSKMRFDFLYSPFVWESILIYPKENLESTVSYMGICWVTLQDCGYHINHAKDFSTAHRQPCASVLLWC